jgi:hypothetical protein
MSYPSRKNIAAGPVKFKLAIMRVLQKLATSMPCIIVNSLAKELKETVR